MLNTLADRLERFIDLTGGATSWLSLLMVIITFMVVVLRYLFDAGSIAMQESITYLHATLFLVGSAWTLRQDAHVRVDILYNRCSERTRAIIDLCGSLFLLLPLMLFIAWVSWEYVAVSWDVLEGSREAGGLPGVYLLKSLILVMAALLVMQAMAIVIRCMTRIRGDH